ncbi:phosphoenolpyruvate--protein phosphotransferase [Tistlia consotensis]|uniref:Phosphoenolpyruvate-protein phosphotransferase n=1 Tax=Tistlia consotensis USBA 355 TaxID=560819 RepID=A0A1Y6CNU1_9PROT|nr:phosphoenolpyruvate--protein phosphotransferase [Tistlia consotensis]SMF62797.1 phosphoenolpyruvate--protein phosphotransferase [Tistlia consotensis USBA 355]SNR95131.1 phosphoenolpyruvate--protein phosphotransferase [Tistlia consotensis]
MKTEAKTGAKTAKDGRKAGGERVLQGLGVAPGIAIGAVYLARGAELRVPRYQIPARRAKPEVERYEAAIRQAMRQLDKLRAKAEAFHGASAEELGFLLEAHGQMLRSGRLREGVRRRIVEERNNAEYAVAAEIEAIAEAFGSVEDDYLAARAEEVRQVGHRILRNLTERTFSSFAELPAGSVILAEEVTPADTALMDPHKVGGFASVLGGAEGHTAIMARSLGIPAVLGVAELLAHAAQGAPVIVDGDQGLVVLNPTKRRLESYRKRQLKQHAESRSLGRLRDLPAETLDGCRVRLLANLELPGEVEPSLAAGAEGVGLLRTEFLFMNRDDLPDEDEQAAILTAVVKGMAGRPVTVRTLDVGGEKLATALGAHLGESANPALGLRAIRLSLRVPELLEAQLAAILRAGAHGPVRMLLPMVASVEEVRAVRVILQKVVARLRRRGVAIADPLPPLGAMIEIPGAALAADALIREVDFFAIGTNDLIMYTLAIDRGDERVAHLYDPLHPAVLRLIHFAADAALRAGKPVSVCGEMAGDPRFAGLFVGWGIRELSMRAPAIPQVKRRLRAMDSGGAGRLVATAMLESDRAAVSRLLEAFEQAEARRR